jgi:hypothetical protein
LSSADIAVAHLTAAAPIEADRFDIYRNTSELNGNFDTYGYGRSGIGNQGAILPAGTKRDGDNRVDAFGQALNGTVYAPGSVIANAHLVFDFDNGNPANDASGFFLGMNNLGLGTIEVSTAPGDSGGPALIGGRIAGVTSFGQGFNGFTDVLAGTNSSFGEFAVDTRVSAYAGWIDSVVDIIAPSTPTNLNLQTASDTGSNTTDNITNDTTPTFDWSASSDTGSGIARYWWAVDDSTPQTGGTSTTSLTATPTVTANGSHTMYVIAEDVAGNFSSVVASLAFVIDTGVPTTPGLLNLVTSSDTGSNTTDNITNDTTPTFDWSASSDTGSGIARYWWAVDDSTPQTGGTSTTSLTATPTVTANGSHTMYVIAEDVAGNFSNVVADLPFIIDTVGPKITDVLLHGSLWQRDPYSYEQLVAQGKQLWPIYTEGADRIQVEFDEPVNVVSTNLKLYGTNFNGTSPTEISNTGFNPNAGTNLAQWSFAALDKDKYRIDLSAEITDVAGNMLDGEWADLMGKREDRTDDVVTEFPTGDNMVGTTGNLFKFIFAILPGDYNQDGIVDAADYVVWQQHEDTNGPADGNGDGWVDTDDFDVWTNNFHDVLAARKTMGDYNDDDRTDWADFAYWKARYGSSDLTADGNQDSVVDGADYVIWRYYNDIPYASAWELAPAGSGSVLELQQVGTAPSVINVTISGSSSAHDPFSFDSVDGSGLQLRTVPVGGADTIAITFSENVNIIASSLFVVGLHTANLPTLAEFTYDMATMTAAWRFDDLVANDMYLISLGNAVTDVEGNLLDGEWVNPASTTTTNSMVSEFPSGDGEAGGDFAFIVTLLAADANLDNVVDAADYDIWQSYWAQDGGYVEGDFAGDGIVGPEDLVYWQFSEGLSRQSASLLADLNGDFAVDEDDMYMLGNNMGMANPTQDDGDLNGDGVINVEDYDLALAQFGLDFEVFG